MALEISSLVPNKSKLSLEGSLEIIRNAMGNKKLKPGRYRHYKGGEYELIGLAKHSETLEHFVVYRAFYGKNELWIRPLKMFCEEIEIDGKKISRFEYIGESFN